MASGSGAKGSACRPDQRLDLGGEGEGLTGCHIVERLDPKAVARQKEFAPLTIPDRKRPHPVQAIQACLAPLRICRQNDLRIAAAAKAMPKALQLFAQFDVVVNLAVEHDPEAPIGADHWLMTGRRQVENRKAAKPERQTAPCAMRLIERRQRQTRVGLGALAYCYAHPRLR
jgi:hypothetical protein